MQQRAAKIGMNRTGIQLAPEGAQAMLEAVREFQGDAGPPALDAPAIGQLRAEQGRDADRVGSVPPPGSLRGLVTTGVQKIAGKSPELLLDKLAERLAFERSGVRLYTAFLDKCRAAGDASRIPIAEVEHIREEELDHFHLLDECITSLGGDPTVQTPCADTAAVMSMGVVQVLTDPRTSIAAGLEALLTAELVDNASWDLLIELAREAGQEELVTRFEEPRMHEAEHLEKVRDWLRSALIDEAG